MSHVLDALDAFFWFEVTCFHLAQDAFDSFLITPTPSCGSKATLRDLGPQGIPATSAALR
jgi:hypothetical protein